MPGLTAEPPFERPISDSGDSGQSTTGDILACAACGGETANGKCRRCGLETDDIEALRAPAFAAYARARSLAAEGRFAEAQAEIAEAKRGGLGDDPSIARLKALCAEGLSTSASLPAIPVPKSENREAAQTSESETRLRVRTARASAVLWCGIGAAAALSVVATTLSVVALTHTSQALPPQTIVVAAPTPAPAAPDAKPVSASPAGTAASAPSVLPMPGTLPANLRREYEDARSATDEQTARRWLNEGLQALEKKDFSLAETLGNAAYTVGTGTYLADDALLLVARAADNRNDPQSPERWARIADERPYSAYAPTALKMAARAARRLGKSDIADRYLDRLRRLGRAKVAKTQIE